MDRRQKKTRAAVFRAFTELLEKMNYSDITVQDIIDTAGIPFEYRLNHIVSSFAETVRWWLTGHNSYTPEEISRFFFESVEI